jgi:hypothetical protein
LISLRRRYIVAKKKNSGGRLMEERGSLKPSSRSIGVERVHTSSWKICRVHLSINVTPRAGVREFENLSNAVTNEHIGWRLSNPAEDNC